MPGALAHIIMAEMALNQDSLASERYRKHSTMVYWGAQGPDPLFYYGLIPLCPRPGLLAARALGQDLHARGPQASIGPILSVLDGISGPQKEALEAYVFGLCLHYLLDTAVHPWVFWKSGFDDHGKLSFPWIGRHGRLETRMDIALRDFFGWPGQDKKVHHLLGKSSADTQKTNAALEDIGTLWGQAFPNTQVGRWMHQGLMDQASAKFLLDDPGSIKEKLLSLFVGPDYVVRAMVRPTGIAIQDAIDVLNLGEKTWVDPVQGTERNESVVQLLRQSLSMAMGLSGWLSKGQGREPMGSILGTMTYDGHPETQVKLYRANAA